MALVDFSLSDIGSLFTGIREALTGEKIVDPIKAQEMVIKLTELEQKLPLAQIELLKVEASHASKFVAGARPFIIWICGIALGLMTIPKALVLTILWTYQVYCAINGITFIIELPVFPDLGVGDVIALIIPLLGLAGLRTYEKQQGIDTKKVGK